MTAPKSSTLCNLSPPAAHSGPAAGSLKHNKQAPTNGPLHPLLPLSGMFLPRALQASTQPSGLCSPGQLFPDPNQKVAGPQSPPAISCLFSPERGGLCGQGQNSHSLLYLQQLARGAHSMNVHNG